MQFETKKQYTQILHISVIFLNRPVTKASVPQLLFVEGRQVFLSTSQQITCL